MKYSLVMFLVMSCPKPALDPLNASRQHPDPFEIIAGPTTPACKLATCLKHLGPVTESPGFWSAIVEDATYAPAHRRACAVAFFSRHVKASMQLGDLALLLRAHNWTKDADIEIIKIVLGQIPVHLTDLDTVICVRAFVKSELGCALYVRVKGKVTLSEFVGLVRGDAVNGSSASKHEILEAGVCPNNSDKP
jgi:hypothetical protein